MFRLVCYDIRNPKRLVKVAKVCEQYGVRLQRSCFQADIIDMERYSAFMTEIRKRMNMDEDSLIIYPVCTDCERLAFSDGPREILDPDRCILL